LEDLQDLNIYIKEKVAGRDAAGSLETRHDKPFVDIERVPHKALIT
jgi:hypothetical protein